MSTKKSLFGILSLLVLLSMILAACAAPTAAPTTAPVQQQPTQVPPTQAPAAKGHHIALVQFLKGHPVHRIMQLGFHEGCVALKYDCELLLTDSTSAPDMIPLAEQALAEPVDGIVFYAVDNSFFPTIAKFKAKGIPVVTPHFTSFDQTESGLTAVVGADVAAYGKAVADAIGDKLAGKGTVAVTEGSFNQTENLAATSFGDEMKAKYPNVKVLPAQEEGFDQAGAIAKAEAIIQGNPDISAAFSTTGSGPTTWSTAAADTGKKDLVIISMDYTRPNLDLVKAGKVYGLVAQPLYDEFYQAVVLVGQAIDGKPIQYKNLLPAPVIFLKDLDKYYAFNDRAEAGIAGVTAPSATATAAGPAKGHHIALVQFLKGHPVHRIMQLGFHEGCVALKYDCELLLTDSTSAPDMIPLAEQALAEPVDGIVFYAVDNSFFPTIAKFKAKGIPVVTPHFTSFDQTESGLTAVVGADVAAYGKAVADAIGDKLAGKGTVAVTEGSFNQTENLAATSFGDEMKAKYPNVKVLPAQEEGFDQAGAIAKAEAIIQGNPDITAAFSTTGSGPTTWSTAAADTGKKDLVIISMDYTRPNLDLVKAGKVYGLVAQPLYDEFYQAVVLVGEAIDGKPVQYKNLLPAPVIFLADLDKYYAFNDRAEAGIAGVTPPSATATAAGPAKGHHIALVQFLKGHPVHRIMQLGFHEACVALKYDCELLLTDSTSAPDMIPLAEQALAEPVDGIVFYAVDNSFFPTIAKFKAKGIPVVTPHFTSFDQTESGLTAVVGADVAAYGKAVADAIGDKLAGKGTVAVTEGSFNQTENLAATSFGDEMKAKYPNVKVLPAQEEGFDQAGAIAKAEAIIQGNPDITAAFSTTGSGPTTWSTAAADTGKKDLVIISMDYTRPNLDLVKAGKVYGLVAQPLYDEFYQAVVLVGQAIDGKAVTYRNLLPAPVIFLADLDKYYAFNDRAEAGISGVTPPQTPVPTK